MSPRLVVTTDEGEVVETFTFVRYPEDADPDDWFAYARGDLEGVAWGVAAREIRDAVLRAYGEEEGGGNPTDPRD